MSQRINFKVLNVDPEIHTSKSGDQETKYQMGKCWDGTRFEGEPIIFNFACEPGLCSAGDIVSGLTRIDQPTFVFDIAVEQTAQEILKLFAPEPFKFPEEPAPQPKSDLMPDLETAVAGGYLAPADLLELARRVLALEKVVKERIQ